MHSFLATTTIIANRYEYDHMGRKLSTFENINSQGEVAMSHLSYNEIGQLRTKGLHNDVQQTTFAYNERGWLKNSVSNEFSMQLSYNDGTVPQFNGNIAAQYWGAGGSLPNYFSYGYDKLDRLESAISPGLGISELMSYDVMGNINTLNRDGTGANQYNYLNSGNQLGSVSNLTGAYGYDANGNAVIDGRNGMSLTYNYLNLPVTATKPNVSVAYSYNASGTRLSKVSTVNGLTTSRQYVNGIEYRPDGTIDIIHTEEGVAQNNGGTYTYHYNLGDHLGNVRYTFDIYAGAVRRLQADDYYAFGKRRVAVPGSIDNKYLYNGKEVQDELQEQYDYGARFYDPIIGRWNVVDPLSEKFHSITPYNYTDNNPVNNTDPDGMDIIYVANLTTYTGADAKSAFAQLKSQMSSQDDDDKKKKNKDNIPLSGSEQIAIGLRNYGGDYSGSAWDNLNYVLDQVNQFNPIADLTSGITGSLDGTDWLGNPQSKSETAANYIATIPLGKVAGAVGKIVGKAELAMMRKGMATALANSNNISHIMQAKHGLGGILKITGSERNVVRRLFLSLGQQSSLPASGTFERIINVYGKQVTVRERS